MPQSFSSNHYHIVFSTKDRVNHISKDIQEKLYGYIGGIVRNSIGTLIIAGGTSDHIHLLLEIKRDVAVTDALRLIKTNSSKSIHEQYPTIPFGWQAGYSSFSVSKSVLPKVISYIQNQEEHHRKLTFQEEYRMFLKENGIEFDEKYMWD